MEPILMILPPARAIMTGATARARRNMEVRFVASTRSHSSSVTSTVFFSSVMPALLTRMSTGPSVVPTSRTAASISAARVTSSRKPPARLPGRRISSAVFSAWSIERAQQATSAPAAPSASAMARPIPRLAPVTSATRPFKENQSGMSTRPSRVRLELVLDELAEAILLDLTARGHGELGDDLQALGELLLRELLGVEVGDELVERDRLARPRDHEGAGALLEPRVGHGDDRHAGDLGMGEQQVLHLRDGDVLAPADDQILRASGDGEVAFAVERGAVAGLEPAFGRVG